MLKNKQPMPVNIRATMQQQQLASARNRRLAQQMENRPSVQAALKLKQVSRVEIQTWQDVEKNSSRKRKRPEKGRGWRVSVGSCAGGGILAQKGGARLEFLHLGGVQGKSLEVALGDLGWDWALWVGKSFLTWTEGVESVQSRDTRMEKGLRALRDLCDQGGARSGKDPSPRGCRAPGALGHRSQGGILGCVSRRRMILLDPSQLSASRDAKKGENCRKFQFSPLSSNTLRLPACVGVLGAGS